MDRDLYVFALGRDGRYVAFGAEPDNVGQLYNVTKGQDAGFLQSAWAAAEAGGGWVQSTAIDPITQRPRPKESWIVQLDEETLLGCGVHRGEATDPVAQPLAASTAQSEHHPNQPAHAPA
jgi:signal transduction histidine kinase